MSRTSFIHSNDADDTEKGKVNKTSTNVTDVVKMKFPVSLTKLSRSASLPSGRCVACIPKGSRILPSGKEANGCYSNALTDSELTASEVGGCYPTKTSK